MKTQYFFLSIFLLASTTQQASISKAQAAITSILAVHASHTLYEYYKADGNITKIVQERTKRKNNIITDIISWTERGCTSTVCRTSVDLLQACKPDEKQMWLLLKQKPVGNTSTRLDSSQSLEEMKKLTSKVLKK